jgi:ABC-type multidrug transport system fused ATPase/permease subunit
MLLARLLLSYMNIKEGVKLLSPAARSLKRAAGAIEFREVNFAFDGRQPVLKNISFSEEPGTRLGIKGRTGAGKSTLLSRLCRIYDPQTGQILLNADSIW